MKSLFKKILIVLLISFFSVLRVGAENATSNPTVEFDGFNISEENHAKITGISLKTLEPSNLEITGSDADKIMISESYNNHLPSGSTDQQKAIYYYGPITFGSANYTAAENSIDATIKMRWENAAQLFDGTEADVIITISEIKFNVTKKRNNISATDWNVIIAGSVNNNSFVLYSYYPQKSILSTSYYDISNRKTYDTGAYTGNEYKVNIKLVNHGTNTPIDSTKYRNIAFGMYDIDVVDKATVDTSSISGDIAKYTAMGNGPYAESIEFISGFENTVHLASNTPPADNIREQSILKSTIGPHNGVQIRVDGSKTGNTNIRTDHYDNETYWSGFMTMASPQNMTFYWRGTVCGSEIANINDVNITQRHNADGNVSAVSYGDTINYTEIDTTETTGFPIGSTPTYSFAPKEGYRVKTLLIDGVETAPSDDYTYTFNTLVYNPLVHLNPTTGKPTGELLFENHSIEIIYEEAYTITTEVEGGTINPTPSVTALAGEDKTITYSQNGDNVLVSITVDGESINIDDYKNSYTFEDINENHTIKVVYKPKYIVTTEVVNGTIDPDQSITALKGEDKTITYSPDEGYELKEVLVDGNSVSIEDYLNNYTFEDIDKNHTIKVVYGKKYKIETEVVNGTIDDGSIVFDGDTVTINYNPNSGYEIDKILVDGKEIEISGNEINHIFKDIDSNHTIKVIYKEKTASAEPQIPKTGDNIMLYVVIALISLIGIIAFIIYKKKSKI